MEAAAAGPMPLYSPSMRERTLPPPTAAFVCRRVLMVSKGCEIAAAARPYAAPPTAPRRNGVPSSFFRRDGGESSLGWVAAADATYSAAQSTRTRRFLDEIPFEFTYLDAPYECNEVDMGKLAAMYPELPVVFPKEKYGSMREWFNASVEPFVCTTR